MERGGVMRILGVIPARGGSVRVPRKNLQSVGGMTLVERAIEHATGAELLTDVVLSTDDDEIMSVAVRKFAGRHGVVDRRARLGVSDSPMVSVLQDALRVYPDSYWDAVVTIQPTSPLRTSEDIDGCIKFWIDTMEQRGRWPWWSGAVVSVSDKTGGRNGAVYVSDVTMVRAGEVFAGEEMDMKWRMDHGRSLDINTPADLEEARRILGP